MRKYQGLPITPDTAARAAIDGGHAFVSFRHAGQLGLAVACSQSFAIDNGAFSAWKAGEPVADWSPFYDWAGQCKLIPHCDFAVIPDVIDGRNIGIDQAWRGTYSPPTKEARAALLRARIEAHNSPATWDFIVPDIQLLEQGTLL